MNNFEKTITAGGPATIKKRAKSMSIATEIEQTALINSYKREKAQLELDLDSLMDLAPDSTTSLNPRSKDWNPNTWVKKVQEVKLRLKAVNEALEIAEETHSYFFTELEGGE